MHYHNRSEILSSALKRWCYSMEISKNSNTSPSVRSNAYELSRDAIHDIRALYMEDDNDRSK